MNVRRLAAGPIVRPSMLPGDQGDNINGPSLIRAPGWLPAPLGRYYLYFAHHGGAPIRLAYADALEGPWRVHAPGTLQLAQAAGCEKHIASPDVHVDDDTRRLVMYFHGPARAGGGQQTFVACSANGLEFTADPRPLASFYLRAFRWREAWYGVAKGGLLWRSVDGRSPFERGPGLFGGGAAGGRVFNAAGDVRHVALELRGSTLQVYFSRIGDAPERILRATVALDDDWTRWRASATEEVLAPETADEGADLPVVPSVAGAAKGRERALRDPAIFREDDRTYLLYSVAGESGIGIAEIGEERVEG